MSDIIQCVEAVGQPVDDKLTRLESWWDTKTQEQKEMKKQNSELYIRHVYACAVGRNLSGISFCFKS